MRKTSETIKEIKPDPKIVSMFSSVGKELRIVDKVDVVAHNFNISLNSFRKGPIYISIKPIEFDSYLAGSSYVSDESFIDRKNIVIQDNNEGRELHNSVLSFFIGLKAFSEPDKSFEKVFSLDSRNNNSFKLTPDMIWVSGNKVYILEVKTSISQMTGVEQTSNILKKAFAKYSLPSYYLKGYDVKIGVILVTRTSVHTNLNLSEGDYRMILAHFKIGQKIVVSVDLLIDKDKVKDYKSELDQILKTVGGVSLQNIPVEKDLPYMDRNYIRSIYRPDEDSEKYLYQLRERLFMRAALEVKREGSREDKVILEEITKTYEMAYKTWRESGVQFFDSKSVKSPCSFYNVEVIVRSPGRIINKTNTRGIMSCPNRSLNFQVAKNCILEVLKLEEKYRGGQESYAEERMRHQDGLIKISLSREEITSLEKRGVYKIKNLKERREKSVMSKGIFSSTCETLDIELFLNKGLMKMLEQKRESFLDENSMILIDQARSSDELYRSEAREDFVEFSKTAFGNMCLVTDRIIHVIVCAAQNTYGKAKGSFIVKKVPELPIFVILKVTTPSKNFVCSILAHSGMTKRLELPFGQPESEGSWNFYDFKTLDRHRAFHLSFSFQKMFSLLATFCELRSTTMSDFLKNPSFYPELCTELAMAYLVHQEGKQNTSNDLQINRYFYMNSIKSSLYPENNMLAWKKLTMMPRSRLHALILRKMLDTHHKNGTNPNPAKFHPVISKKKGIEDGEENEVPLSYDRIEGLLSWVTGTDCPSFEHAINFSYLGVIHNKDELNKDQAMFKVFEKIISEEMKLEKVDKNDLGLNEPSSFPGNHEFSPMFVRSCTYLFRKYLNKSGVLDIEKTITDRVSKEWDKILLEFATFKASTSLTPSEELDLTKTYDDDVKKAIEQVMFLLKGHLRGSVRSLEVLKTIIELVEKNGVKVSIFKKQQIGGTREICILDMASRILINFLETTSRVICEMSEIEMMTKKKRKTTVFQSHFKKVSSEAGPDDLLFSVSNSNDCKTWCQKFVMPVFANMTQGLLDFDFHVLVCRILNCVTEKRLLLPSVMLSQFHSNSVTNHGVEKRNVENFDSPGIKELKRQSQGFKEKGKKNSLIQPGERSMNNLSNMMQGILHFTSSLLHTVVMHAYQWMINGVSQERSTFKANRLSSTIAVSSDDSASLITLICKKVSDSPSELLKQCLLAKTFLLTLSKMSKYLYPLFSAAISEEKSSMNDFSGKLEFNSLFIVKNTLISPILKFVYAAVTPKVSDSVSGRLDIWGNLRMQLISNGGSFGLCSKVQICQAYSHYQCFGSGISDKFPRYRQLLSRYPMTQFGFFTFEPDLLCGMFGNRYANYLHMESNPLTKGLVYSIFSQKNAILNEFGSIDLAVIIKMGSRENYQKFLERNNYSVKTNKLLKRIIEPEVYFRDPMTPIELNRSIYLKMYSHDAANSFVFDTGVRMMHSAVYILDSACLSVIDKEEDVLELKNKESGRPHYREKKSMIQLMEEMVLDRISVKEPECNTFKNMQALLFPLKETYDQATYRVKEMKDSRLIRCEQRACKLQIMSFSNQKTMAGYNVLDVCRHHWFSKDYPFHEVLKMQERDVEELVSFFKIMYPWFKDTFSESLTHSQLPISTFINNIKNNLGKTVTCTTLAPPYWPGDDSFAFAQLIRNNFSKNGLLVGRDLQMSDKELSDRHKVLRSIYNPPSTSRSLVSPLVDALADLHRTRTDERLSSSNFAQLSIATHIASLIRDKAMSRNSSVSFFDEMSALQIINAKVMQLRKDEFLFYSRPQDKLRDNLGSYRGRGEIICKMSSKLFKIFVLDDKICKIYCNLDNQTSFMKVWPRLKTKLFQEGFNGFYETEFGSNRSYYLTERGVESERPEGTRFCILEMSSEEYIHEIISIKSIDDIWFEGASDYIVMRHKNSSAILKFRMPVSAVRQSPSEVVCTPPVTLSMIWSNGDILSPSNIDDLAYGIYSDVTDPRNESSDEIFKWIDMTIRSYVESNLGRYTSSVLSSPVFDSKEKKRLMTLTYSEKLNSEFFPEQVQEAAQDISSIRFINDMHISEPIIEMKINADQDDIEGFGEDASDDSDEDNDENREMEEMVKEARQFEIASQASENLLNARLAGSLGFSWDGRIISRHPFWRSIVSLYVAKAGQDAAIRDFLSPVKTRSLVPELEFLFEILNHFRSSEEGRRQAPKGRAFY